MFYDLNVKLNKPSGSENNLEEIFSQLVEYGYRGVAVTVEVNDADFATKKDKSKKKNQPVENEIVPKPIDVKVYKGKFPKLNIYKRINIVFSESGNIRKVLQSKYIKLYDLVSFQPENQNALKSLTTVPELDIISYNPENRCTLSMNRKLYNQFVNQNVYFEIMYVPAIISQSARRNLISRSHRYHAIGKSKNVIVTSGTERPHHIRGPYDVMNFNLLFGLSEEEAKKAISRNCEKILLKARKHRLGKGMAEISYIGSSADIQESLPSEIISDFKGAPAIELMEE